MATIGPTFRAELVAEGVPLDGVMWTEEGIVQCPDVVRGQVDAVLAKHDPTKVSPPDNPTLGDWRVALTLWGRIDDVVSRVAALVASDDTSKQILGKIASERLNYSNNVMRDQLMRLKDAFGFTVADVDESLWRAHQVSLGDLSGVWPLPPSKS